MVEVFFTRGFPMKQASLKTRLNTRLFVLLFGIGLLFSFSLHYYLKGLMAAEVEEKAHLVFSNLLAVQTYVRETLRPVMYKSLPEGAFIMEGMSTSYVTRMVMSDLNMAKNQFTYRRVALDPRNPDFYANELEQELIRFFQNNPDIQIHSQFIENDGDKYFLMARPAVFEKPCLVCHGQPQEAPNVLLNRYGDERGFYRKEGEIGGLDSLIMPVERESAAIRRVTLGFVIIFCCGTLVILGVNHFFFDRIMILNIGRLTEVMRNRFPDEADKTLVRESAEGNEIDQMIADIERLADLLHDARNQLAAYAANLESIFEGIADPLFLLNSRGEIVFDNSSAKQLAEGISGSDAYLADILGLRELTEDFGKEIIQKEVVLPDRRSIILRAYPLKARNAFGQTVVYARDNTLEKKMTAQFQQSEKAVALGLLASGLAHEINNPLGVILCYTRLLWDDGKSPHAEDLDIIIRHTLQAQRVLRDLMRFAQPKAEVFSYVNFAEIAGFIARVFSIKAAKQGISITVDCPPDLPPVRGTISALEQILTNLIINALDALENRTSETQGEIIVSAHHEQETGEVVLTVQDNGPGIAEENLNRVFDPFFTTKQLGRGTGLGLSVVYGLVMDLGGQITVENRDGAVFSFRLKTEEAEDV